ncbi:B-cell receptor-associated protein 31-like [Watersipora subatra]|uniref:B-cell receptor-associated protein 31-like n=1 Tax=Watersipora subatra TaxID=2589382 RepID=UPI00355C39A6
MSFQWTAIAVVLYCEIALTLFFLLPFISSRRWKKILQSRLVQTVSRFANYYFSIFMVLLGLCFIDSIREMRKYQNMEKAPSSMSSPVGTIEHINMRLFRAQRNFYIAGFSLFLWFVLRRLVTLIIAESNQLDIMQEREAAMHDEMEAHKTKVRELTERLDQANEAAIAGDSADNGAQELHSTYDRLRGQLEANRQVENLGDGSTDRELQDELQATKEHLDATKTELADARHELRDAQEELERLVTDHQHLEVKYNSLVESGGNNTE